MWHQKPLRGLPGKLLQLALGRADPQNLDRDLRPASPESWLQRHSSLTSTFLQLLPAAREEQTGLLCAVVSRSQLLSASVPLIPLQYKEPGLKTPQTLWLVSGPHNCFQNIICPILIEHLLCARHCAPCQRSSSK